MYMNIKYQSKHNYLLYNYYLWAMFRLSRVIFRPYKEQIQGYLSVSCTLGSQAHSMECAWYPRVHDTLR